MNNEAWQSQQQAIHSAEWQNQNRQQQQWMQAQADRTRRRQAERAAVKAAAASVVTGTATEVADDYDGWESTTKRRGGKHVGPPGAGDPERAVNRQWEHSVIGVARGVSNRMETYGSSSLSAITFRVERYDDSGNRLAPVNVQMRGLGFNGAIGDGELVEVRGRLKDGTVHADRVYSHDTGAILSVAWSIQRIKRQLLIVLAIAATVIGFAVVLGWQNGAPPRTGLPAHTRPASPPDTSGTATQPSVARTAASEDPYEATRRRAYEACLANGFDKAFCENMRKGG